MIANPFKNSANDSKSVQKIGKSRKQPRTKIVHTSQVPRFRKKMKIGPTKTNSSHFSGSQIPEKKIKTRPDKEQFTLLGFSDSGKSQKQARTQNSLHFSILAKQILLKSMGKFFPHPVGVFRIIPNPPKGRIIPKSIFSHIQFWSSAAEAAA